MKKITWCGSVVVVVWDVEMVMLTVLVMAVDCATSLTLNMFSTLVNITQVWGVPKGGEGLAIVDGAPTAQGKENQPKRLSWILKIWPRHRKTQAI